MRKYLDSMLEMFRNRIVVMFLVVCGLFMLLVARLFSLQIVNGEKYDASITASVSKTVTVTASRGNVYDRNGVPLAVNNVAYSVQIDNSVSLDLTNYRAQLVLQLVEALWAQGAEFVDTLPISTTQPYTFEMTGETARQLNKAEKSWKQGIGLSGSALQYTAEECLAYLYEKYDVPERFTTAQKRAFVSLCLDLSDRNLMALTLAVKMDEFGETLTDELPLSQSYPYTLQFNENQTREQSWKKSMGMKDAELEYDSLQTLDYLRSYFGLPEGLPNAVVRNTLGIRYSLYLQRYQQYQSVTIATEISDRTLAYVEENQDIFPNVIINTVSLREYPQGQYFSHLLGYIRQMTESDFALYKDDVDEAGNAIYSATDIVGQSGIEKLYERELNGTDGTISIEVDSQGRRMSVIDTTQPVSGKDVVLTLDSKLQKLAYDKLEDELRKVIVRKLTTSGSDSVSLVDLFSSMVSANHISASKIRRATEGVQFEVYQLFLAQNLEFEPEDEVEVLQNYILDALTRGAITSRQALLLAMEQGTVVSTAEERDAVQNGTIAPLTMILNKLESGELTPADTAVDPCTGSVFVTMVDSGEVLVSVTYPSYDNNMLVNNFDNEYYNDLLQDTNTPLVNRPLKQKKAPGSTFKMVTALAGLETNVISTNTIIRDLGLYRDAGTPYARCWIYSNSGSTHGNLGVAEALEVSCNYFFYEVAYRMGNATEGASLDSITTLNEYMVAFGLNTVTGVELEEYSPTMASPYYKERMVKLYNPDASTSQTRWTDGDTIRAAIGQSVNSYTPAQITRYIATLANGGSLYRLHMVDSLQNPDGSVYSEVDEVIENVTTFDPANLATVYQGMYQVTTGVRGTLRNSFRNFPMKVAAKTGTAEEDTSRSSHTWLVCFAPLDDPQIAITVMIPFGEGSGTPAPEVAKAIITEYFGLESEANNTNLETLLIQ